MNGWSIARHGRDRTPDRTQRLLNHASWDTAAAMSVVRRFAASGLQAAARRGRRGGLVIGAIDETGQEKAGEATAGVKRTTWGAGKVANGITTVHLAYVREKAGHALIGARQWVPREQIEDPVKCLVMGLPLDLQFRTKGQLAIDISKDAAADGIRPDFYCGDEVYGSCTQLREHFEACGQAYVLRVPSNFTLTVAAGTKLTCAQAVAALLKHPRRWEVRSAGSGSKGERWYAWAWIATASPRHHLLIRRHQYGEMARRHWARWLPERFAAIEDPEAFFAGLGEEAEQRITTLAWELAGDDPPGEGYLDKAGRLGEARHRAEQIVLAEMILLPPETRAGPASPQ